MVQGSLGEGGLQAARDRSSTSRPLLLDLVASFDEAGQRLGPMDALHGGRGDVLPTANLVLREQLSVSMRRPVIGCFWQSVMFSHVRNVFTCIETSLSRLFLTCRG